MKFRDLTRRHGSVVVPAWPPKWSASYGFGDIFPTGLEGILTKVEPAGDGRTLKLTIRFDGREFHGLLRWEGPPSVSDLERLLENEVDQKIEAITNKEI